MATVPVMEMETIMVVVPVIKIRTRMAHAMTVWPATATVPVIKTRIKIMTKMPPVRFDNGFGFFIY
jgi:hypothetical protein